MSARLQEYVSPKTGQTSLYYFAFWAALLCVLLLTPQVWALSGWLSDTLLAPEFGMNIAFFLRPLLALCLVMVSIYAARTALASSLGLMGLTILTKLF